MPVAPFEVLASPFEIYIAPIGTAFPNIGATPTGSWVRLGTAGSRNQAEGGIEFEATQTIVEHRVEGETAPIKVGRTSEAVKVRVNIVDMSPVFLTYVFNGTSPTSETATGSQPAFDWVGLYRGTDVQDYALLLVGPSPLANATNPLNKLHIELPKVMQTGQPKPVFSKGKMAELAMEFTVLIDPNASEASRKLGRFCAQDT